MDKQSYGKPNLTSIPRWVWGIIIFLTCVAALAAIYYIPERLAFQDLLDNRINRLTDIPPQAESYRRTMIQALGAVAVIVGFYLTLLRIRASERQVAAMEEANVQRHDAAMAQLKATEDGQVTERFSRAVEQIGSDNLATRVGGIYALERLARDSKGDHPTVVETMCAFIREESSCVVSYPKETNQSKTERPRGDVKAACDVVCRLSKLSGVEQPVINFEEVKLANVHFDSGDFTRANFEDAHLNYARFKDCTLDGAQFVRANMQDARIKRGSADETVFNAAKLNGTVFRDVNPANCKFLGDQFEDVSFYNCDLRKAKFFDAVVKQIHEIDVECKLDPATENHFRSKNIKAVRERAFVQDPFWEEEPPEQE